jgi:uncharacterized RDD family membrane protein YckC
MPWHIVRDGRSTGPIDEAEIARLAGEGGLAPDDLVWRPGLAGWIRAREAPEMQDVAWAIPPSAAASAPSESALPAPTAPDDAPARRAAPPVVPGDSLRTSILGLDSPDAEAPPLPAGASLAAPWPRYWARQLDLAFESLLVGFLVGAVAPSAITPLWNTSAGRIQVNMIFVALALLLDAIVMALFGTTFGKALQGLRVRDLEGRSPRLIRMLQRNLGVFAGCGFGVPVISLITYIVSYRRLSSNDLTFWDRNAGTRVFDQRVTPLRTWLTASLCLIVMAYAAIAYGRRTMGGH